jgi:lysosomal Pro-X carboxypeptidase
MSIIKWFKINFISLFLQLICITYLLETINNFDARKGMSKIFFSKKEYKDVSFEINNNFTSTELNARKFLIDIAKNKINPEKIAKNLKSYFDIFKVRSPRNNKDKNFYEEHFFSVKLDHYALDLNKTFKMRYLVNDEYFDINDKKSPIFFYCGNEGPIEEFWKNSGFITKTLASIYKGLVLFAEHRFFGKSMPFGESQNYDIRKNKYLTVEQALGDYVEFLEKYRKERNWRYNEHPIVAVGGSYGGMLASWGRMKFPHIFHGAIASSAPILLFEDIDKISNSFFKITTETYRRYDNECPKYIRAGFETLSNFRKITKLKNNPLIYNKLNEIFKSCSPITNSTEISMLEDIIEDALVTLAQYNYPYENSLINSVPGEPVKVACNRISGFVNQIENESNNSSQISPANLKSGNMSEMMNLMKNSIKYTFNKFNQINDSDLEKLHYLKEAISVFFNYTGNQECLDIGNNYKTSIPPDGWSFLACSEMILPMEKNGITDMFNPKKWDLEEYTAECKKQWKTDVRPTWAFDFFGGRDFYNEMINYSNIIFTSGKMDPWNAGCPHEINKGSSVYIIESDSAHHLDLRLPHLKDPESVIKVRQTIIQLVSKWIS